MPARFAKARMPQGIAAVAPIRAMVRAAVAAIAAPAVRTVTVPASAMTLAVRGVAAIAPARFRGRCRGGDQKQRENSRNVPHDQGFRPRRMNPE
jgi:hypothetical protein